MKQGELQSPLEESIFPSPVLRTYVSHRENLCKKILDREVSLRDRRETKSDGITLQFLLAPELLPDCSVFCRTPCSVQHRAVSPSTEFTGLLSLPEMAVLPISPAESSANEIGNVFK